MVFCGVANDYAKLAALAAIYINLGDHLAGVQVQAVGFRAIHDTEAAALLGSAFLVDDLRYVIHAT